MRRFILAAAVTAVATMALAAGAVAGNGNVPATQATFNGTYSATFVRSASGLVMETNRVNSAGAQNDWTDADVWLQFRPTTGYPPNAACNPVGLVTQPFLYVNDQPSLDRFFDTGLPYNVCVYLVNPQVASGTLDSSSAAGTTATLPTNLSHFRIDVSGTWQNGPWWLVDAEYVQQQDSGGDVGETLTWLNSWPGFAMDFGDVMVDGTFMNWGDYSPTHDYSLDMDLSASVNLALYDSYYEDNEGSLDYTITYIGP